MRAVETLGAGFLPTVAVVFALMWGNGPAVSSPGTIAGAAPESKDTLSGAPTPGGTWFETMTPVLDTLAESLGSPLALDGRPWDDDRFLTLAREPADPGGVHFLLVTAPDYVDSNTAWMADEILSAVQAAMPYEAYFLNRFSLPDLSGTPPAAAEKPHQDVSTGTATDQPVNDAPAAKVAAARNSHESRPGILTFRGKGSWYVVLVAPETPTSGLHVRAFENAARLIARFHQASGQAVNELRVVGPTFSGSVDPMVASLERLATDPGFDSVRVVSGSATDDQNLDKFKLLCDRLKEEVENHCSYASAMHSNRETIERLYDYLFRMNPSWVPKRIALLTETNTTFGRAFDAGDDRTPITKGAPLGKPHTYYFPLHISQLRADARAAPELPKLLTTPAVALRLGEAGTAIDQVPPLRPGVASPLTERLVDQTLDDIRHEGFAAVGIYATDVRDTLYLSREIKRTAPDVQLFFPSAHLLYLHPDFIPYIRGAIVASTYPLRVSDQRWSDADSFNREVFASTVAQGVFNATLAQVAGLKNYLPDYPPYKGSELRQDAVGEPELGPKPGLWLSVVGDDGFWPLEQTQGQAASDAEIHQPTLERVPGSAKVTATVLAVFAFMHACAFLLVLKTAGGGPERLLGWVRRVPIIKALVPPPALPEFGRLHTLMSGLACANVSVMAFWYGSMLLVWAFGSPVWPSAAALWLVPTLGSIAIITAGRDANAPWSDLLSDKPTVEKATAEEATAAKATAEQAAQPVRAAEWVVGACYAAPLIALLWFVSGRFWSATASDTGPFHAMTRAIGGGSVSPAALTLCTLAAMYVPVIWSLRRLSLVGYGYTTLARKSDSFTRLLGGGKDEVAAFSALLDMPTRHLPKPYLIGLVGIMFVIVMVLSGDGATVDGPAFSAFLALGSLVGITAALAMLAQAVEIWRQFRRLLWAMKELPLWTCLSRLTSMRVHWSVSVLPPNPGDVRLPLRIVDSLQRQMSDVEVRGLVGNDDESALHILQNDAVGAYAAGHQPTSLTQSATFLKLWLLADRLMPAVDSARWMHRRVLDSTAKASDDEPVTCCRTFLDHCETFLAVQRALVLRDVVARIMAGILASMVTLGLLTSAHLFYVFQGRSSYLTLDVLALGVTAVVAVWLLLAMEHDPILQTIWQTTPGRVDFNWGLVQRLTIYGVLPMLVVTASLFPEVGEQLLKWLEPLRRLAPQ